MAGYFPAKVATMAKYFLPKVVTMTGYFPANVATMAGYFPAKYYNGWVFPCQDHYNDCFFFCYIDWAFPYQVVTMAGICHNMN